MNDWGLGHFSLSMRIRVIEMHDLKGFISSRISQKWDTFERQISITSAEIIIIIIVLVHFRVFMTSCLVTLPILRISINFPINKTSCQKYCYARTLFNFLNKCLIIFLKKLNNNDELNCSIVLLQNLICIN